MKGERSDLGWWQFEVFAKSGEPLYAKIERRHLEIQKLTHRALTGDLGYPQLPRETEIRISYTETKRVVPP